MLTSEVKQRVNTCRDILVGKLPDPKSQVLQITNALIYKFMDDQDRMAEKLGGKASFFIKELKPYAWHKLFDTKLTNQERADLYIEGVQKLAEAKHLPELFQEIFKEAYVPFRAAGTIVLFIDEINKFDYHHSEELGNAYEYLLSIMGSQGDAGQFRTPRHIIEFLVDVVDPQKDETIYDPAAGTAGFLIAAYNHILEENGKLTASEKRKLSENISGVDISPDMAKMARVNLYLHGFTSPVIDEGDTLTDENLWGKKHDVILANPPFMSPKGGIVPHDKFSVKAKRSEVLFVDYIAEHLKLKGRAGVIVPEGVIFQSGTTYKQLRKMLVEDGYLHAVISLPAGVFQPYSGVKTSILILDREKAKEAQEILFLKIENDGYSLSTQRTEVDGNQIPEALAIARAWQQGKKQESLMAAWVPKQDIRGNEDFNLSASRYIVEPLQVVQQAIKNAQETAERMQGQVAEAMRAIRPYLETIQSMQDKVGRLREPIQQAMQTIEESGAKEAIQTLQELSTSLTKWPIVNLDEIAEIKKGSSITSKSAVDGLIPVVAGGQKPAYYHNESNRDGDIITVSASGAYAGYVSYWSIPIFASDCSTIKTVDETKVLTWYLYRVLKAKQEDIYKLQRGGGQPHVYPKDLVNFKIPVPPIEVQKEIVAELDRYQKIIDGARQVVENYKPTIEPRPEWPKMKIADVCTELFAGGDVPRENISEEKTEKYQVPIYTNGVGKKSLRGFTDIERVNVESVTISARGTIGYSQVRKPPYYPAVRLVVAVPKQEEIDVDFLKYSLDSLDIQRTGNTIQQLTIPMISEQLISLPPLQEQQKIVEEIEKERSVVESLEELQDINQKKIQNKIAEVWGE